MLLKVIAAIFLLVYFRSCCQRSDIDHFYHLPEFLVSYTLRLVAKIWLTGSQF